MEVTMPIISRSPEFTSAYNEIKDASTMIKSQIRSRESMGTAVSKDPVNRLGEVQQMINNLVFYKNTLNNDLYKLNNYYKGPIGFIKQIWDDMFSGAPLRRAERGLKEADSEIDALQREIISLEGDIKHIENPYKPIFASKERSESNIKENDKELLKSDNELIEVNAEKKEDNKLTTIETVRNLTFTTLLKYSPTSSKRESMIREYIKRFSEEELTLIQQNLNNIDLKNKTIELSAQIMTNYQFLDALAAKSFDSKKWLAYTTDENNRSWYTIALPKVNN
jgi:hypothetical protein